MKLSVEIPLRRQHSDCYHAGMTIPEGCPYLSKDLGNPEEGCVLCPGRSELLDAELEAALARLSVKALEPSQLCRVENGPTDAERKEAAERVAAARAEVDKRRAIVRRAFKTCVGPHVLWTVVNGMRFSVTICTSPDYYGKGEAPATANMQKLPVVPSQPEA